MQPLVGPSPGPRYILLLGPFEHRNHGMTMWQACKKIHVFVSSFRGPTQTVVFGGLQSHPKEGATPPKKTNPFPDSHEHCFKSQSNGFPCKRQLSPKLVVDFKEVGPSGYAKFFGKKRGEKQTILYKINGIGIGMSTSTLNKSNLSKWSAALQAKEATGSLKADGVQPNPAV